MLKRFLVAVPLAAAVTGGLFVLMSTVTDVSPERPMQPDIVFGRKTAKAAPTSLPSATPQPPADGAARPIVQPLPRNSCGRGDDEVVLDLAVEADGSVSDVKVVSASSSCFAEAATRAVLGWRYRPRVVGGRAVRSRVRETVHFRPPETTDKFFGFRDIIDGRAVPIVRAAPWYPPCGKGDGKVVLEFTVKANGTVHDVRVIEATSSCFAKAAKRTCLHWRYRPRIVDGQPVSSKRLRATILFKHGDSTGTVLH